MNHPTRSQLCRITCVLVDDDAYEITVETIGAANGYPDHWRFRVADAEPYPVGSTITLEVPA
jgi:hypothetical protein